jgi:hypothetical protein
MKIKADELERLAGALLGRYKEKDLMTLKTTEAEIKKKIGEVIAKNFAEEEEIEEEARKMLASVARVSRDMDPYRMFLLAKQKLAAKKGFIL